MISSCKLSYRAGENYVKYTLAPQAGLKILTSMLSSYPEEVQRETHESWIKWLVTVKPEALISDWDQEKIDHKAKHLYMWPLQAYSTVLGCYNSLIRSAHL